MNRPIIKEITNQKCIGYRQTFNGGVASIILNEGVSTTGAKWQWKSETVSRMGNDGLYTSHFDRDYDWQCLSAGDGE